MDFTKKKLLELLKENSYTIHPHFGCFYNPKKTLGFMFHVTDMFVTVYKIKWRNLDLNEAPKVFRMKYFNPNQFDLKDKQAELLKLQEMKIRQDLARKKKLSLKKTSSKGIRKIEYDDIQLEQLT